MNSEKIILDLCGGTGAWSLPYKQAGYDVRVITLPDYDIFDYLDFMHLDVYGILASPDCSHFSFARQNSKTPRDLRNAFSMVERCREIIEYCYFYGNLKFWALENPVGYLRQILGKPSLTFQAWWYGDPWKKATDLWGYFNLPIQKRCNYHDVDANFINKTHWHKVEIPSDYLRKTKGMGLCRKKIKRAITPPGFARAFFAANQ